MTSEFDLPCSACGNELQKAKIDATDLEIGIQQPLTIEVAVCQSCEHVHYPADTLVELRTAASLQS